ncbi:hypothetical protein DAIF1_05600 [Stenotrophomonas indicatrix]|jgi:hypothetical protein|nr:hypothetical protein DAIF1_05600 [Stenotrophomonas indicatrix]
MPATYMLKLLQPGNASILRIVLLLLAAASAVLGLTDREYQGRVSGGCSQALSPFLKQATSSSPRAISFCNLQNADTAEIVVEPIAPGTTSITLEIAGYGDTAGISAVLAGPDEAQIPVPLPRAGDRWVRWTIQIPPALQGQQSRLIVRDQTQEGFGWIGVGLVSGYGGWLPVSIALLLTALLYPWLGNPKATQEPAAPTGWGKRTWLGIAIGAATLLALVLRRPSQWSNPYVWVEDGKDLLPQFLQYGWSTLLHPVAGYILIPNKLINAISVTLSFRWLPEISLALAAMMTVGVMVMLALAPTRLKAPWACALAVLAVPTDPEVFSTSAYALWWGGFLVLMPLFWDERRAPSLRWRMPMLLLGALSSPLIVMMTPLYGARALLLRRRTEWCMFGAACVLGAIQATLVVLNPVASQEHRSVPGIPALLERFLGHFLLWRPEMTQPALIAGMGLGLLIVILIGAWAQRREGWVLPGLIACFLLSVAAAAARVPVDPLDPFNGGPRYFFYPYIFLAWILIHLISESRALARAMITVLLLVPITQTVQYGTRTHATLDWRQQLQECTSGRSSTGPFVHWTGRLENLWNAPLTAEQCRQLVSNSLFDNTLDPQDLPPSDGASTYITEAPR